MYFQVYIYINFMQLNLCFFCMSLVINGIYAYKKKLQAGHQPLSWTARAQIGLDAARGIEYIHDHTKGTYVHRDIKTSNILLDSALRAKVSAI